MKKIVSFILTITVFLTCLGAGKTTASAMEAAGTVLYAGIDVSKWQGSIDFAQVKAAGIEVVYIKSSEGNDEADPYYEEHYQEAKAQGLKIGFYHYVTAETVLEAKAQADYFLEVIADKEWDCRLAMDFESFGSLSNEQVNEIALAFLQRLEAQGQELPVVYGNRSTADGIFDSRLAGYPLWIAEYGVSEPKNTKTWPVWTGFQYTDTGSVPGVSGNVDRDHFTEDIFLDNVRSVEASAEPGKKESTITVTVKKGDTLSGIAAQYGMTVSELALLNGIANPDLIYAGEAIKIPT